MKKIIAMKLYLLSQSSWSDGPSFRVLHEKSLSKYNHISIRVVFMWVQLLVRNVFLIANFMRVQIRAYNSNSLAIIKT